MKYGISLVLFSFTISLIGCNSIKQVPPTSTVTPTPSKTPPPTLTSIPSVTPTPTDYRWPTITAFETQMANVCPTTTPPSQSQSSTASAGDAALLREFAGNYSYNTGLGGNILIVGCDGIYHEEWSTDTGTIFFSEGKVEVRKGQLILTGAKAKGGPLEIIYSLVRWGQRKYLIESGQIINFCEKIHSNGAYKEPRIASCFGSFCSSFGLYFLKIGDDQITVTGSPISASGVTLCN